MKTWPWITVLLLAITCGIAGEENAAISSRVSVVLSGEDLTQMLTVNDIQEHFLHELQASRIAHTVHSKLSLLVNVIDLTVHNSSNVQLLQMFKHVQKLFHVSKIHAPRTTISDSISPQILWTVSRNNKSISRNSILTHLLPHALTGVSTSHKQGINGTSIRIAIIDTGLDGTHPAFANKIAVWRNYIDDGLDNGNGIPVDCGRNGHGTRVAGIAAGMHDDFVGVAPGAQLGIYRVYDCNGEGDSSSLAKALEDAIQDGMDVVNLSLGSADPWNIGIIGLSVNAIVRTTNTIVVSAAGNDGGLFTINGPGSAKSVLSVASFDSCFVLARQLTVNKIKVDYLFSISHPPTQANLYPDIVILRPFEALDMEDRICYRIQALLPSNETVSTEINNTSVSVYNNKTVVVFQSRCPFDTIQRIALNLASLGALSIILVLSTNDLGSTVSRYGMADVWESTKWMKIGRKDGERLFSNNQSPYSQRIMHLSVDSIDRVVANLNGKSISWFSSFGPTAYFDLKPEIAAFGGAVYTTFPMSQGMYGHDDGTSFAAPYVSGVVALLQQYFGKRLSLPVVRTLLMNAAVPGYIKRGHGVAAQEALIPVQGQGAGLVQVMRAMKARATTEPAGLEFTPPDLDQISSVRLSTFTKNITNDLVYTAILRVHNSGRTIVRYRVDHLPAASVDGAHALLQSSPGKINIDDMLLDSRYYGVSPARLDFNQTVICLKPNSTASLAIKITPDLATRDLGFLFSGFVQLQLYRNGNNPAISKCDNLYAPYAGYNGRLSNIPIFPVNALTFSIEQNGVVNRISTPVIALNTSAGATLRVDFSVLQPSRQLYLNVFQLKSDDSATETEEYIGWLSRNMALYQLQSTARWNIKNFRVMRWDADLDSARAVKVKVPGRYRLKLSSWWGRYDLSEDELVTRGRHFVGPIVNLY